jgi:hypothetical protein
MTRQLQDLFNLPIDDEIQDDITPEVPEEIPQSYISEETLNTIEKVESALPAVRGLEASDQEMDELGALAKEAFENLMDLGMQVDSRFASEIFNSASSMLGHAITTKTAKVNKKLKMLSLQLQQAELERKLAAAAAKGETNTETTPLGQGTVLDRNELIKQILEQSKSAAKDK